MSAHRHDFAWFRDTPLTSKLLRWRAHCRDIECEATAQVVQENPHGQDPPPGCSSPAPGVIVCAPRPKLSRSSPWSYPHR